MRMVVAILSIGVAGTEIDAVVDVKGVVGTGMAVVSVVGCKQVMRYLDSR